MTNTSSIPPHIQLMTIAEIGGLFDDKIVNHMKLLSDDYLLDADVILISIRAMQLEFSQLMQVEGIINYYMPRDKLADFNTQVAQRKKQLEQYLDGGGILFVFMDNDPIYAYKLGVGENSENAEMDFWSILLLNADEFETTKMRGTNIVYSNQAYLDFFNVWDVSYNFVYTKFKGFPTAQVKNTKQAISVAVPHGKGMVFLLPDLKLSADDYEDYETRQYDSRIAILNFIFWFESTKPQIQKVSLPEWGKNYMLGDEGAELKSLEDLQIKVAELQEKILRQYEILQQYDVLKQALSGTGKPLEAVIENILAAIGFEFLPTQPGRDDLIIRFGDEIAVIEIKGVKGSASEQNATQLMKWVTNYHHENAVEPKGILIVNAFKDIAPNDRKEGAFPHQMLAYSERMRLCLMTTYQLLGLYLDLKAGDISLVAIKDLLFNTVGKMAYQPSKIIEKITDN